MGVLTLISVLVIACSKDFEDVILDDFDFSFSEEHPEGNYVFEKARTTFSLVPGKEISTVDYFVRFSSENVKGYFLTTEGDTIRERDTLNITDRNWAYNYVAIDTGAHKIRFTVWDSNARTKELELLYNARYASFSFLLNKGVDEFIINSRNPVNVTLLRDKETEDPANKGDFEISYQIENGSGQLYLGEQVFDAGKPFVLPKGISEMEYHPENLGEHKLIITAMAPDGATLTEELLLSVLNLDFSINATAASTKIELDTNLAIAIDLNTDDAESDVTYEISHAFASTSEGSGTVRDHNGGVMEPGQYRKIVPESYNYTFTSTELGKRKIYFDLRDSNGQAKRDSVEIEVANIPFTVSGSSENNSVFTDERTQFNFNIRSKGNIENIEYSISYDVLEGNGRISDSDGVVLQNSTSYPVELGNFSLFYFPENVGSHQISFLVTDNYGQGAEPVIIDLETNRNDFTVTLTSSKTTESVNIPVNLIIDIDEIPEGANDTYEAFYSSVGNSSIRVDGTEYGPGETFRLRPDNNNVVYTGSEPGQHDIVLSVESSADVTHTANVSIGYDQVDFSFTGGSQKSDISVGETIGLNFNISQSIGSSDYTMRFTSNGNALIRNENGVQVSAGNIYNVSRGNFNWSLEGTDEADITLTFYVLNDTGLEKTVTVPIGVTPKSYNFTANTSRSQADTGEVIPINFNITELGIGGDTYVMYFSSGSSNGSFEFNGTTYAAGESFTVAVGSFQGGYTGISASNHNVGFTVRSSSGVEKTNSVSIEVSPKEYNFTANATRSQADTGEAVAINFNITELGTGGDSYSMVFASAGSNGNFAYNGRTYTAGETFNVPTGSFQGIYTGLSASNHAIGFTVNSSSDVQKTNSISIDVTPKDYNFSANSDRQQADIGEDVAINFNITELGTGGDTYTMYFSSGGSNGSFEYQGTVYAAGESFSVSTGPFQGNYKGLSASNHNVGFTVRSSSEVEKTNTVSIDVTPKNYNFSANALEQQANTGDVVDINFNLDELGTGGDTYTMSFSSGGSNGSFEFQGAVYSPGERFDIPVGIFLGKYTGISESNHNIEFTVQSSSNVEKTADVNIRYEKYEEFFDFNLSQSSEDKYEGQPFSMTVVTNATTGHDPDIAYAMTFNFSGASAGYIIYKGIIYREGDNIPIDYGSTPMRFYPETDENFSINFRIENTTGISQTVSESVVMLKKPTASAKGEKINVSCGGINGCDYEVLIYTCFDTNCSEAYNGATLQRVEIRIYNRFERKYDTKLFNYNDAGGSGVNRRFRMEIEPSEGKLKYLDQRYEVRVQDSNGQWSEVEKGTVQRV